MRTIEIEIPNTFINLQVDNNQLVADDVTSFNGVEGLNLPSGDWEILDDKRTVILVDDRRVFERTLIWKKIEKIGHSMFDWLENKFNNINK